MTHSASGWTENNLYAFQGGTDGAQPIGGLLIDQQGILYGTTAGHGSSGGGTVFTLTPQGGGWGFAALYSFSGNEFEGPYAGLVSDRAGNLYGTTYGVVGGACYFGCGSVFELFDYYGGWTYTSLHYFTGSDGANPISSVVLDANGNLYGTAPFVGVYDDGVVFKLTPSQQGWTYNNLHVFTGGSDGALPFGGVTLDANGNLYGTALGGGDGNCSNPWGSGCGTVWKITP